MKIKKDSFLYRLCFVWMGERPSNVVELGFTALGGIFVIFLGYLIAYSRVLSIISTVLLYTLSSSYPSLEDALIISCGTTFMCWFAWALWSLGEDNMTLLVSFPKWRRNIRKDVFLIEKVFESPFSLKEVKSVFKFKEIEVVE